MTLAAARATSGTALSVALVTLLTSALALAKLLLTVLSLLPLSLLLCRSDIVRALLSALHGRLWNELTRLSGLSSDDWRSSLIVAISFILEALTFTTRSATVWLTLATIAALSVATSLTLAITAALTTATACGATTAAIHQTLVTSLWHWQSMRMIALDGNADSDFTLNRLQGTAFTRITEGNGDAARTRATGAANAMYVAFGIDWQLVVNDVAQALNVDAARRDVGRDQHSRAAVLEIEQSTLTG